MKTPQVEFYAPEVESLSKEELRALQFRKLCRLLAEVYARNPFYQEKFSRAGVSLEEIRTPEDIRRLPLTTKTEVLEDIRAHPPYGKRCQVPAREIVQVVETSGTSGQGKEAYGLTVEDCGAIFDMEACGFFWAGIRRGHVVMNTLPMHTSAAGLWYYHGLLRLGVNLFQVGPFNTKSKLDYMRRFGAEGVIGSPSYLRRLEAVAEETGVDLRRDLRVERIVVAGEPFSEKWVQDRESLWGAKLFEQYGSTQRAMAWTCERGTLWEGKRGMLHGLPHRVLYEVLDRDTREPVPPGKTGELVITPLDAQGSPLIRFATQDRVRLLPAEYCGCGRTFDGIESGTVTRYDNMLRVKGVNFWPETVDSLVLSLPEVREYRGEILIDEQGRERVLLRVEFRPEVPEGKRGAISRGLEVELREKVGVRFELSPWQGEPLFRTEVEGLHKSQRWVDRRRR